MPWRQTMTSPSSAASGMSKREHFAGLALLGIVGWREHFAGEYNPIEYNPMEWAGKLAVEYADALIKALNETSTRDQ